MVGGWLILVSGIGFFGSVEGEGSCWTSLAHLRVLYNAGCGGLCQEANFLRSVEAVSDVIAECGDSVVRRLGEIREMSQNLEIREGQGESQGENQALMNELSEVEGCGAEVIGSVIIPSCENRIGFSSADIQPYLLGHGGKSVEFSTQFELNREIEDHKCSEVSAYILGTGTPCPGRAAGSLGEELSEKAIVCGRSVDLGSIDPEMMKKGIVLDISDPLVTKLELTFSQPIISIPGITLPTTTEEPTTQEPTTQPPPNTETTTTTPKKAANPTLIASILASILIAAATQL